MSTPRLIAVLISSLVFFSCKQKKPEQSNVVPVNLYTATLQRVLYYDQYPSTTEALSQVSLLPQVQGYVTGIFFTEGTLVHKGQKLYEIDQRLYQAAYDQAVANLKVSQGNQTQAQQDADRYTYLNENHAVAKQLYDHAIITLDNAKNQVKASEEAVKTAKTNLTYAVIYAPFDGTIGFSQVKLGNMVVVGQTILNTISTNNPLAVDFLINEKQLPFFEKIAQHKIKPIDSLFTLLLPDNTLYNHLGKISVIDRAVDPQTGSIRVRLEFPNADYTLKAGMSCIVRVHNQDVEPQLVIPNKAVVEQMGEYFVFIAKDTIMHANTANTEGATSGDVAKKDGSDKKDTSSSDTVNTAKKGPRLTAVQRKVQLGQIIGPNVVIKAGINAGDKVVVDGIQSLHDGSPITTANKVGPSQGGKRG